ncbi:MAG TPA: shikimate dehydrogenase [Ktedonobacteraceae bacterium]|nr:shikimate dehydrogenase [Ktedonobacteraceae bacterium]
MNQVGLIGYPVSHSLSPIMQQAAFDKLKIDACYILWETPKDQLTVKINSLRSPDIMGANITIPYKENVLHLVDDCDPFAARIGAINTIVNRNGRLFGYNTDAPGFITALLELEDHPFECAGKNVVILGTGGAARAAVVGLVDKGVGGILLVGRTETQLQKILQDVEALTANSTTLLKGALFGDSDVTASLPQTDLVVNATPVGLKPDDLTLLIDVDTLPTSAVVMDMIFNPPLTPLLRSAKAHGCQIMNGLSMLLYQGALAFELWTSCPAPIQVMQRALGILKES